ALCADSATLANFTSELSRAYSAGLDQHEEPFQYADFVEWQLELLDADDEQATTGKDYWRNRQAGVARSPLLPMQKRIVNAQEFAPGSVVIKLDSLLEKIEALAGEQVTSVATVLF